MGDNEEVDGLSAGRGVGQELEGIGPEVGPGRGPEAEDGEVAPDRIPDPFQDQGLDQEVDDNGKIIKSGKNRVPLTFNTLNPLCTFYSQNFLKKSEALKVPKIKKHGSEKAR